MIKDWLKKWLGIGEGKKYDLAYLLANRHYFQSISPSDLDDHLEKMTEQEKREYLAEASQIWNNRVFRQELRWLFGQQALFVALQCENWEQSLIGRGTVNGIGLVEDRFQDLESMHQENIKPKERPEDEFRPIPEI